MFLTDRVLSELQASLLRDVWNFLPEVFLCATLVLLLVLRLFRSMDRTHLGRFALLIVLATFVYTLCGQWLDRTEVNLFGRAIPVGDEPQDATGMFSGLLAYDRLTIFLRMFLLGSTAVVMALSLLTGIPDAEDSADFNVLLLGATVGMMLMASANHLLMVYIAVEMASLPSYALAGFLKGRRQSSEAALKYVVYGGGASGLMLYGISLLAGKFGTGYLPDLAAAYATILATAQVDPIIILGTLFLLIGVAFKLSAVPFHFWCPDVFEGAAAEVAGFLSVASKGAALALLGRFVMTLAGTATLRYQPERWLDVADYLTPSLAAFAALTATFGNLAAYLQTNLKRMLAYSTIAHAGYMLMAVAPLTREGFSAVLFYLVAYLFMNLGAFAIIAFLRNQTGSEDLADFRGLVHRSPLLVVMLGVCLFSLLGVPPLAGFAAKFQVFRVLFDSGRLFASLDQPGLSNTMYALLVVGGINTVVSVVYYLKVLKVMILDKSLDEVEGREPQPLALPTGAAAFSSLAAVMILVLGVFWGPLAEASQKGVLFYQNAGQPQLGMKQAPVKSGPSAGRMN